jgi:hypothetical protein
MNSSKEIKKLLNSMLLLCISLVFCINSINICDHNEINDHDDARYQHIADISSECEHNQSCDDCVEQTTDFKPLFATGNILSRLAKQLSAGLNDFSYFVYIYPSNNFRDCLLPLGWQLFTRSKLLQFVILRL